MSASAQSFIAFLMWGVGMFVGAQLAGVVGEMYPPQRIAAVKQTDAGTEKVSNAPLPGWPVAQPAGEGKEKRIDLAATLGSEGEQAALLDAGQELLAVGQLKILGQLPDDGVKLERRTTAGEVLETTTYAKEELITALRKAYANGDGVVTRPEWRRAQSHTWPPIWLWPCALAALICVAFLVGGRDVKSEEVKGDEEKGEESPPQPEGEPAGE
jgi:hypothetical protein